MNQEIFKIYQDKIVIEPTTFNTDEFYYFYGTDGKVFGIQKAISENEYKLIKSFYLEKTISYQNKKSEVIYKYIYEDAEYPFSKKVNFLLYKTKGNVKQINSLLEEVLTNVESISIDSVNLIFFEDDQNVNMQELFQTISDDFGYSISAHLGLKLNKTIKGSFLAHYVGCVISSKYFGKGYSNLIDIVFSNDVTKTYPLIKEIKTNLLEPVLNKNNNLETLDVFFKNDLNVSKTAKELYLNRNSLINRLDIISKDLGFDVQNFKYSAILLIMINLV